MIKIACFQSDATPPLGSPLCDGGVKPAKKIVAPLSVRGLAILGAEAPIVLCAVDWVSINGGAYDFWRKILAEAAGTTVERVAVHVVHPHDTPGHIFAREELPDLKDTATLIQDTAFAESAAQQAAQALRTALPQAKPVTHFGYGKAKVRKVASNRRILGNDGRVAHMRWSSCLEKDLRDLPEGLIDPWLQNLSFWNGEEPLVSLTYYATHPQSFYGEGAVSPDFVGLARSIREATLPDLAHIHFNGCGGNLAAGKYNDRSPENRLILAQRLLKGMEAAWARTKKFPVSATDFRWQTQAVKLPLHKSIVEKSAQDYLQIINSDAEPAKRNEAAQRLAYLRRWTTGLQFNLACLRVGRLRVLHVPGEMFVEYQLAAQQMRAPRPVLAAANANDECGYIGTKKAYEQGGYETEEASRVGPESEAVILQAMRELLGE